MISWLCCFYPCAKVASHGRSTQRNTVAHLVSGKEEHGILQWPECEIFPRASCFWMLGPRLVVLFWEVLQMVGSRILLEEVGHRVLITRSVLPWVLPVSLSLLPRYHAVNCSMPSHPPCHAGQMPLRWWAPINISPPFVTVMGKVANIVYCPLQGQIFSDIVRPPMAPFLNFSSSNTTLILCYGPSL